MSATDEIRAELDLENQRQAEEEAAAQAQIEAATQNRTRFADPTDDHKDYFNYVESRGFLQVFFESILVNFGPNPDPGVEAAFQRDLYFDVAGFTSSDAATDHRMQFASSADSNGPAPAGYSDLGGKIAPVTNFSRGTGDAVTRVYEAFDGIYGETTLAAASRGLHDNFSQAAANIGVAPTQHAEINHAPELLNPAA